MKKSKQAVEPRRWVTVELQLLVPASMGPGEIESRLLEAVDNVQRGRLVEIQKGFWFDSRVDSVHDRDE